MATGGSERYARQAGLVRQERLDDLLIGVSGRSAAVAYLLANLALLGAGRRHGGIILRDDGSMVQAEDVGQHPFLLSDDIGFPFHESLASRIAALNPEAKLSVARDFPPRLDLAVLAPSWSEDLLAVASQIKAPQIWGAATGTSVVINDSGIEQPEPPIPVLATALSSLCGGLMAHEVLLKGRTVRASTVVSRWVTVNYHLRAQGNSGGRLGLDYLYAGATRLTPHLEPHPRPGGNDVIVRVPLPDDSEIARLLGDAVELVEDSSLPERATEEFIWSPALTATQIPEEVHQKAFFVAGVGGLGTWASLLLAHSPLRDCSLTIVDMDGTVEVHNLNRQILFSEDDLGKSKVFAAQGRLQSMNPTLTVDALFQEIGPGILDVDARTSAVSSWPRNFDDIFETFEVGGSTERILKDMSPQIAKRLSESDVVLTCLDNLHSRFIINSFCDSHKVTIINGASQELEGRFERISPRRKDPCLVCRYGTMVKEPRPHVSCSEEGEVSVQAMVTTIAIVASVQVLLALLAALDVESPNVGWFRGRTNELGALESGQRRSDECPAHLSYADQE